MQERFSLAGSQSPLDLEQIFAQMPGSFLVVSALSPGYTIALISDELATLTGRKSHELTGRPLEEVFTLISGSRFTALKDLLTETLQSRHPAEGILSRIVGPGQRVTGSQDEWKVISKPVFKGNDIQYIILSFSEYMAPPRQQELEHMDHIQKTYFHFMEAPVAICIVRGADYIVELANDDMLEFLGRTPAIVGKPILEVLPEAREQGLISILDQVRTSGKPYYVSTFPAVLLINKVRELRYFDLVFKPYYQDAEEQVPGSIFCVAHNVTEQVDARNKVKESERRYRALIEESSVATALYTGPELCIQYANDIMLEYLGKDATVIGRPFREAVPELLAQPFGEALERVYTSGNIYQGFKQKAELVIDGKPRTFYFDHTCKPLRNEQGEVYGIHHMAIDVTKEVLSANKLQEETERKKLAIDLGEMGLFEIDLGTREVIADERCNQLLGIEPPLTLEKYMSVIHPDDVPNRKMVTNKSASDNLFEYEFRVLLKDNKLRWIRSRGMTYQNQSLEVSKIFGVVQDITRQKEYEQELSREVRQRTLELESKNRELQRSNENLEEFAHAASHDLKEPIRKIRFFTDRLKDQLAERISTEEKETFKRIDKASERMGALIDDLLLYSHISHRPLEMEEIDLNQKIIKVLEDLDLEVQEKNAVISIGNLPRVKGYRRQLQQLFQNLVANALKYNRPGVAPHITISASLVDGDGSGRSEEEAAVKYHLIEVSDNGIGFDPAESERIFQMFQRLHGNTEYSGTGVGLSIVKKVAENHNGRIEAEGRPGEGSIFKLYLPV